MRRCARSSAAILEDTPDNRFLADFRGLQRTVAHFGQFNALSQTLLKLTSPGVPDIYQGNEIGTSAWSIPITAGLSITICAARS